jgi:hypothetical protein
MSSTKTKITLGLLATGLAIFWGCANNPQPAEVTKTEPKGRLPQDVLAICTVSDSLFNTWFVSGKATENGKVMNANSVTFPSVNNCSFYQWSEQMFLWLASPNTGDKYTPGNTVFESPLFYDVSEANPTTKQRTMTQHEPGKLIKVSSSIRETGPNGLPLVIDDKGQFFEVETHTGKAKGNVMAMSAKGVLETKMIAKIEEGKDPLHHVLKDKNDKVIENFKPVIEHKMNPEMILSVYEANNKKVFIDAAGNEHNIAVGQATGNVLIAAQNKSLVYYVMMVNDVYAYYRTAVSEHKYYTTDTQFPTTAAERDSICSFARRRSNGTVVLPDSSALAMELKLALVETAGLKDVGSYVTIKAEVPVYDTTNKYRWVPTGKTRVTTLAVIGMHVVGSLAGHPEMSWATFEHKNNAPNAAYDYLNKKNDTIHVEAETGSGWLLCNSSTDLPYNVAYMTNSGDTIDSTSGHTISASSTNLVFPYGAKQGAVTNPENKSAAASNSEVIAINNSVINQLAGNDLRKNYIMIGATWTSHGANPTGHSYSLTDTLPGVAIGTSLLANTTMETYFQTDTHSCFTCHHGPSLSATTKLSHIFNNITPLLPKAPTAVTK